MNSIPSFSVRSTKSNEDISQLSNKIETGFPSPASDHLESTLNLNELIVHRPTSTFYVRVEGNAMQSSGIHDGDILVIDRSLNASNNSIVLASLHDEVIIRRYIKNGPYSFLVSDKKDEAPIQMDLNAQIMIWGIATYVIHRLK